MASAKNRPTPQGFEPGKGFPPPADDDEVLVAAQTPLGQHTHLIGRNSAVCGVYPPPTDAGAYVTQDGGVEPSCPTCLKYYKALLRQSARNPSALPATK